MTKINKFILILLFGLYIYYLNYLFNFDNIPINNFEKIIYAGFFPLLFVFNILRKKIESFFNFFTIIFFLIIYHLKFDFSSIGENGYSFYLYYFSTLFILYLVYYYFKKENKNELHFVFLNIILIFGFFSSMLINFKITSIFLMILIFFVFLYSYFFDYKINKKEKQ